jgi:hypothetical protein
LDAEKTLDVCVAQKMYWASKRSTSRVEDLAYCLLGMFDISCLFYTVKERMHSLASKKRMSKEAMIKPSLLGASIPMFLKYLV